MAIIFGLTASFSLLHFGKADAVSPSKVVEDLRYAVEHEHLLKGCDLDLLTHDTDNRCELYGKSFREVVARYTDLLGGCLAKHEPIPFNCRVFASYAFSKFSEKGFNCQYLKIDDAERGTHAVVLVPCEEDGRMDWYICDFTKAVADHDASWLFVPLTKYMNLYHKYAAPLRCLAVCGVNSDDFFGAADYCDLRVWFVDVAKDRQAAESVIRWELSNRAIIALPSNEGRDLLRSWAFKIADLYMGCTDEACLRMGVLWRNAADRFC